MRKSDNCYAKIIRRLCIFTQQFTSSLSLRCYTAVKWYTSKSGVYYCIQNGVTVTPCVHHYTVSVWLFSVLSNVVVAVNIMLLYTWKVYM